MFTPKTSPKYGLSKCENNTWHFLEDVCMSWRTFLYELDLKYENFDLVCFVGVFILLIGFLMIKKVFLTNSNVSGAPKI